MMDEVASPPDGLACLLGRLAPPELSDDLLTLLDLPAEVRHGFGEVLATNLATVIDDRAETVTRRFCRRHEIEPSVLAPSIRACRTLFLGATKAGVDRDAFVDDVRRLTGERADEVLEHLLPLFDEAHPQMVQAAVFQSIAEHGKVVRGIHWRLDVIKASDHSVKLDVPVATITLQYQEGPNAGQASFQLLPDQAGELKRALEQFVKS